MNQKLITILESKTAIKPQHIANILNFLADGCTIPFIARYKKDFTANATDEQLRLFEEIYEYAQKLLAKKEEIANILNERGFLTNSLQTAIDEADTMQTLEDIYAPYRQKKSTRTLHALENGLEPFANIIQSCKYSIDEVRQKAKQFLNKEITDIQSAITGASDIIAQRYADDFKTKDVVRNNILNHGIITTKKTKTFDESGVYAQYGEIKEKIKFLKSYRFLAINRAVNEKQLNASIDIDVDYILENIKRYKFAQNANTSQQIVFEAYRDGLKRLVLPSLKKEVWNHLESKASDDAIALFGKNLKELLIAPPLVGQVILGMDPGFVSGCKLAVIDENANYLDSSVIYITPPKQDKLKAGKLLLDWIQKYKITAIAIGNGTASHETTTFVSEFLNENNLDIKYAVVSEIGASVYSASKIASSEYPELDVTIRGAISIAARLRDPMAELVKIDPKSLGIGQYQHDVDQKNLQTKLQNVTVDLVNLVGVDINSASATLLACVSAITPTIAKNIISYRQKNKKFTTKSQLLQVKGIGAKVYEQSAGFIRIKDGETLLDNTAIHPDFYNIVEKLSDYNISNLSAQQTDELANKIGCPPLLLQDIIKELNKPGLDIREEMGEVHFSKEIKTIDDLAAGMVLAGTVRNITDFGAFVDIGLKNDAMIHISQMSEKRISHPSQILSIGQVLKNCKVIEIDKAKNRVGVSLK